MPKGVYQRISADERFESHVNRSGEHHLWTGPLNSEGYANFWVDGKYVGAHVFAWTQEHGPLPDGHVVRHTCRFRHCVRSDHLSSGTKGDNNRDRERDGTQTQGSSHHNSKLTEADVLRARELAQLGVPVARLARDLGVHPKTLRAALSGRTWRHV